VLSKGLKNYNILTNKTQIITSPNVYHVEWLLKHYNSPNKALLLLRIILAWNFRHLLPCGPCARPQEAVLRGTGSLDLSREGFSTAPHIFAGNRSEFRNRNHKDDSQQVLSLLVGLLSDCQLRLGLATREGYSKTYGSVGWSGALLPQGGLQITLPAGLMDSTCPQAKVQF